MKNYISGLALKLRLLLILAAGHYIMSNLTFIHFNVGVSPYLTIMNLNKSTHLASCRDYREKPG